MSYENTFDSSADFPKSAPPVPPSLPVHPSRRYAGLCLLAWVLVCMTLATVLMGVNYGYIGENAKYESTPCTVTGTMITVGTCYRACNCHLVCGFIAGTTRCRNVCDTCPYACYGLDVVVRWECGVNNCTGALVKAVPDMEFRSTVEDMASAFPRDMELTLYVGVDSSPTNPNTVIEVLLVTEGLFTASMVFWGLAAFGVLGLIINRRF